MCWSFRSFIFNYSVHISHCSNCHFLWQWHWHLATLIFKVEILSWILVNKRKFPENFDKKKLPVSRNVSLPQLTTLTTSYADEDLWMLFEILDSIFKTTVYISPFIKESLTWSKPRIGINLDLIVSFNAIQQESS